MDTEKIGIYTDYEGMVFWESAVVYLSQKFSDFDPNKDLVDDQKLIEIDWWALNRVYELGKGARESYGRFEFYR